ncbi:hypothetical protein COCON_G00190050 [Conger conger]|uniref:YqaJ viral recombinase domain-containing protein n=1 Tax=Conger conger TaxID=82655 RepID=A0A9Q1D453_CONCO|nr:hypothetical protein COCON_G00190050 [Conger conger]
MAPTKTGSTSSIPNASGSSQPKSRPTTKVKNKDSTTSLVGSGDAGRSVPRVPSVPENIWGPGGRRSSWTPKIKTADTAEARNDSSKPRGSRPAASAGARATTPRGARAPAKIPPKGGQPVPTPPKPEDLRPATGEKMEQRAVEELERQTRGQWRNPNWHSCRKNRITASMAHQVAHSRFANGHGKPPPISYLQAITGEKRGIKTRAMTWGTENEAKVARIYQRLKSQSLGRPVRVQDCGLFIDPERRWLGASPDGLVEDAQSGERLLCLEIKCPYKHRDRTVAEACETDRYFCLELQPEAGPGEPQYRLKTKHCYYTQVQCQMAVVGLHHSDFVVYTRRETAIVPVTFDPEFWKSTVAKLEIFYKDAVVPHLQKKANGAPLQRREE